MSEPSVYRIVNRITDECYVGGSAHIASRRSQHMKELRNNEHRNYRLQQAWNEYGEDAFVFEILERCAKDVLVEREQYWIDTLCPAYNIRKKADGKGPLEPETIQKIRDIRNADRERNRLRSMGYKHTPEAKEKMRQSKLGTKASSETIEKLRQSHLGQKPTPEAREKNRQAQLGRTLSEEAREKIRQSKLGKKRSPEVCEKLRQANLGKKQSPEHVLKRTNHPVSEETRQRLREARAKADADGKPHGGIQKGD